MIQYVSYSQSINTTDIPPYDMEPFWHFQILLSSSLPYPHKFMVNFRGKEGE